MIKVWPKEEEEEESSKGEDWTREKGHNKERKQHNSDTNISKRERSKPRDLPEASQSK